MKGYFLPKDTRPGRVQGNPKVHKTNNPLRVIIYGRHGATENITEFVEKELSKNVSNLPSFIRFNRLSQQVKFYSITITIQHHHALS